MNKEQLIELYQENETFKEYVDKYMNQRKILTVDEAVTHLIIRVYADILVSI